MNYDIFIDESGLFTETSADPGDRIVEHRRRKKFPSQLAGVIAPEGFLTPEQARAIIEPACKVAGVTVTNEFHSTEIKRSGSGIFDKLVVEACAGLREARVQPFRMVNRERVSFGDRKANYVNIVGEMLVRICKQIDDNQDQPLSLNIYQAGIKNSEYEEGNLPYWEHEDFNPTLQAIFARASIAAGWASESSKWSIKPIRFRSGKKDERLWLCDLISNASHDDFKTVSSSTADSVRAVIGHYDFSLSSNTALQQVRQLSDRQAYGMAAVELVEHILSPWTGPEARAACSSEFDRVARELIELPPLARGPQLQTVLGWLHQIADDRERLADATAACKWIENRLIDKHEDAMNSKDATLAAWLRLGIGTAWLTACNHGGDLTEGRRRSDAIDAAIGGVAGRWEYASDLLRALVVQAVHFNDCFEHRIVCRKMDLVSDYYRTLGDLFKDVYADVFSTSVSSKVCGEALGTKVQSQIFLLLAGEATVDELREVSEQAIAQFSDEEDRRRQFQFRSEIEAIAGDWESARGFLARGIGSPVSDHAGLAKFIAALQERDQGFPLLHWVRIGGMAAVAENAVELNRFASAWNAERFARSTWLAGEFSYYPVHGILRRVACVYAGLGEETKLVETLRTLGSIVRAHPQTLFRFIEAATVLQSAGLAGRRNPDLMNRILTGSRNDPAARKLIENVMKMTSADQQQIAEIAGHWLTLLSDAPVPQQLIDAAKVVAY